MVLFLTIFADDVTKPLSTSVSGTLSRTTAWLGGDAVPSDSVVVCTALELVSVAVKDCPCAVIVAWLICLDWSAVDDVI